MILVIIKILLRKLQVSYNVILGTGVRMKVYLSYTRL